jgi:hypothetical protein
VHSAGILEALRKVYSADRLVSELTRKAARPAASGLTGTVR